MASEFGLDEARFTAELDGDVYADYVSALEQEAVSLGLPGTPSALVNGEPVAGEGLPRDFTVWDNFISATIEVASLEARQFAEAPPMMLDEAAEYRARVTMEDGQEFLIELFPESAPQTVNSFVFLANEGWFDGNTFHRVLPGFVAQTGDPSGTGMGGPGYQLPNEIDPALSHGEKGMVAMASTGPDTAGSQWYVTLGPATHLDGNYTIFGRVVEGMEVVEGLTPRDPQASPDAPPGDRIATVAIEMQ